MRPGGSRSSGRSKRSSTRSVSSPTTPTVGKASCNADAEAVLSQAGYSVKKVYRVEPDLLLYVDRFDRAMTAYIEARQKGDDWVCRVVTTVPGWSA